MIQTKVFQINSVNGIKSTGRICTDLATVIFKNGGDCLIAYGREEVAPKYINISVKIGGKISIAVHGVVSRLFDASGFGSIIATKKLIKKIKTYDPDIIHLHNLHGYYINVKLLFEYLEKSRKPVIWTLHDCWSFTGHCCHFDFIKCEKWKNGGCFNCPQKSGYPKSMFLDRSKNNFKKKKELFTSLDKLTIVTPSKWLAEKASESYLSKFPIKVINNGIDISKFKPTPSDFRKRYGIEDKKMILGVASGWGKFKGFYDFVKLSEKLDDKYKVVLVGVSKKQKELLPPKMLGIERTDSTEELAMIYSAADVFVNATYEDTYPTVNLEAQACGTPVVTYKTGGSPESVNLHYGTVVEQGNIDALISAIKRTNEKFTPDLSVYDKYERYKEYISLYKELI